MQIPVYVEYRIDFKLYNVDEPHVENIYRYFKASLP